MLCFIDVDIGDVYDTYMSDSISKLLYKEELLTDYPIVLVVSMQAKPGVEDQMRAAIVKIADASSAEDGCEIYQLLQDSVAPEKFLLVERWRDKSAFKAHQEAPHLAEGFAVLENLQAHPPVFASWRAIN